VTTTPLCSIYDGRELAGWIIARGKRGFEAFDAGERSLGTFKTQAEAINKLTNGADTCP
jgi:hypothetical protein